MRLLGVFLLVFSLLAVQSLAGTFSSRDGVLTFELPDGWESVEPSKGGVVVEAHKGTSIFRVTRLIRAQGREQLKRKNRADVGKLRKQKADIKSVDGTFALAGGVTLFFNDSLMGGTPFRTGYFNFRKRSYSLLAQNVSRKDLDVFGRTLAPAAPKVSVPPAETSAEITPSLPVETPRIWVRIKDSSVEMPLPPGLKQFPITPELHAGSIRLFLKGEGNQTVIFTVSNEPPPGPEILRQSVSSALDHLRRGAQAKYPAAGCVVGEVNAKELSGEWKAVYGALDCPGSSQAHKQSAMVMFYDAKAVYSVMGIGVPLPTLLDSVAEVRTVGGVAAALLAGEAVSPRKKKPFERKKRPWWVRLLNLTSIFGGFFLLLLGYLAGRFLERKHYKSIREREKKWLAIPVSSRKTLDDARPVSEATLAVGAVVISIDHYKRFLSSFRMIFGGEMKSYSSLIDRGRREAMLRMKESCPQADLFLNCRLETASISKGKNNKATGAVEVMAYGTAIIFQK